MFLGDGSRGTFQRVCSPRQVHRVRVAPPEPMRFDRSLAAAVRLQDHARMEWSTPLVGVSGAPVLFRRGKGVWLEDLDGNVFLDLVANEGSVLLGHSWAPANDALERALRDGLPLAGAPNLAVVETVQHIVEMAGGNPVVSFHSTGTGAVRTAALAACRVTGKPYLISAGFHGWDPMWAAASTVLVPNAYGVIDWYHRLDLLADALSRFGSKCGAVVFSPCYGWLPDSYHLGVLRLARQYGLLVICDDVFWGFRTGPGPSLRQIGAAADVYVFSKALANGQRLACIVAGSDFIAAE